MTQSDRVIRVASEKPLTGRESATLALNTKEFHMANRFRRLAIVGLFMLVPLTGCTEALRDGFSAGLEQGVSTAVAAIAEAWINAVVGAPG